MFRINEEIKLASKFIIARFVVSHLNYSDIEGAVREHAIMLIVTRHYSVEWSG